MLRVGLTGFGAMEVRLNAAARCRLVASLVLLSACGAQAENATESGTSPSVTIVGDTAFVSLPLGRTADNGVISLTFDAVTEDSRCPSDVQCVWEGNGGVRLTLEGGDEIQVVIVNSASVPRHVEFLGHAIAYSGLSPYPMSTVSIDREAYVATIAVVELQ